MEKKNLSIKEAAEYANLSQSFLYKKSAGRELPMLKCGTKVLIPKVDFDLWLEMHRVERPKK